MEFKYPATITPAVPDGYLVEFLDLEEAFSEGQTIEEAFANGSEVLTAIIEARIDHGDEVPPPSAAPHGSYLIAPDAKTQAAMLLRLARGKKSLSELARALQTSWPSAQRLEDPHHWSSLKQVEKAAGILGRKLVLRLESPTDSQVVSRRKPKIYSAKSGRGSKKPSTRKAAIKKVRN